MFLNVSDVLFQPHYLLIYGINATKDVGPILRKCAHTLKQRKNTKETPKKL